MRAGRAVVYNQEPGYISLSDVHKKLRQAKLARKENAPKHNTLKVKVSEQCVEWERERVMNKTRSACFL